MGFSIGFSLGPVRWSMPLGGGGGRGAREHDTTTTWAERQEQKARLRARRARLRRERAALEAQADPAVVLAAHIRTNCANGLAVVVMILGAVTGTALIPSDYHYVFHVFGGICGVLVGYSIVLLLTCRWVAAGDECIYASAEKRQSWRYPG